MSGMDDVCRTVKVTRPVTGERLIQQPVVFHWPPLEIALFASHLSSVSNFKVAMLGKLL